MESIEKFITMSSSLLLLSIVASKTASRFRVPALLVFLAIGIMGGREGPGGIQFHDIVITQTLAITSLCFILFSGGMDTEIKSIRPILKSGLTLSTIGVVLTTGFIGWFATQFLNFSSKAGLLLGATVASTDVAAVFTALRSRNISVRDHLKPVLEFESAVNDPMTVFLCVGLLQIYSIDKTGSLLQLLPPLFTMFVKQMALGTVCGWVGAKIFAFLVNRVRLEFEGLYPVLSIALVLLIYGLTQWAGGSGFLAVYVAGIYLGNRKFLYKKTLTQFHDGISWLMQITMFLAMGLLVMPKDLPGIAMSGTFLSLFLVFVARPLSVCLCLLPFKFAPREIMMISWAGLRGAVPIILATYPLTAQIPEANTIFNLVFFVVATSVLFQGATIAPVAKWLKVNTPLKLPFRYPIEFNPTTSLKHELEEIAVPPHSQVVGRALVDLNLPGNTLIVLIRRNSDLFVPRGDTRLDSNDMLLVLAEKDALTQVRNLVEQHPKS